MNKPMKLDTGTSAPVGNGAAAPRNGGSTGDALPSPAAIDALADIAKRSNELIRHNAERLKTDDGYQVMDPRTVLATFQEFAQRAVRDPTPFIREQVALWTDLGLLWQRTAARALFEIEAEPVIAPGPQDKRFKNEAWSANPLFDFIKQSYLLMSRCLQSSVRGVKGVDRHVHHQAQVPATMQSFYLHNMYERNVLKNPGGVTLANVPIDLRKIEVPVYFLSTREDHIAPSHSTYAGTQLVSGPVRFVLGASGHVAGVINPPAANKYGYWTRKTLPTDPESWLKDAAYHGGSWWNDWRKWLVGHGGGEVPARQPGSGELAALEDAPGSYVKVRAA